MLSVTVKISGDKELISKLKKLGPSFTDFRTSMNSIGVDVSKYYSEVVFASQGGVLGKKWKSLNPAYAGWKSKHYLGNRGTLIATGKMQNSFTHESTTNSVTIGNSVSYFKYHQSSAPRSQRVTSVRKKHANPYVATTIHADGSRSYESVTHYTKQLSRDGLPRRPMMGINTAVRGIIHDTIQTDVRNKISRAGL